MKPYNPPGHLHFKAKSSEWEPKKKEPLMNHDEPRDTRVGALEILQHEVP